MGSVWREREENDVMSLCKTEKLVFFMGSMTIVNKEDGFARCISCFCLWNKVVFEPLKTVKITCPSIVGKPNSTIL